MLFSRGTDRDYVDKIAENVEERISAWVDIFKAREEVAKQEIEMFRAKADLMEQQFKALEARVKLLDRWTQSIAVGRGFGAPGEDEETQYPTEPRVDPSNDLSFGAMFSAYNEADDDIIDEMTDD